MPNNIPTVKSKTEEKKDDFAQRNRKDIRAFTIADDVEVKGAELKDGLLKVSLEKLPHAKKPDHPRRK